MIIRNTFLNAQMGQIVHYSMNNKKPNEKTLRWLDTVNPNERKENIDDVVSNDESSPPS